MFHILKKVFAEKLDSDTREPFVTTKAFVLPTYLQWMVSSSDDEPMSVKLGVLLPNYWFWVQIIMLLIILLALSTATSTVVYKFIVEPHKRSPSSFLVGFGFVIPIVSCIPFYCLYFLDIRNKVIALSLIFLPIVGTFRCLEALYGYTPEPAAVSLSNYCIYYGSMLEIQWDKVKKVPIRITGQYFWTAVKDFSINFAVLNGMLSLLRPVAFAPFHTRSDAHSLDHTLWELLEPGHLINNYLAALMISVTLAFSTIGTGLLVGLLGGFQSLRVVDRPMLQSTSPSNFWGRRWNQLVHVVLKRGVYKPIQRSFPKYIATMMVFLASGLMHEYVWAILFYVHPNRMHPEMGVCSDCFYPIYGKSMLFFGWNGVVIVIEYFVGHFWVFQWTKNVLPGPIVTILVIMASLPIGHWFTGDWIAGGFFHHICIGFPLIVLVNE